MESDDPETLYVADAGSTNLTQLNGRPLEPRARTILHVGNAVGFGAIETIVCAPETQWNCLKLTSGSKSHLLASRR
jgi:hypothetical protein